MKESYIYIITNKFRTTFYIEVTSSLKNRITKHADGNGSDFTKKYNLTDLVYYEKFLDINQAIAREKHLKNWQRSWKIDLIKKIIHQWKLWNYKSKDYVSLNQVQADDKENRTSC